MQTMNFNSKNRTILRRRSWIIVLWLIIFGSILWYLAARNSLPSEVVIFRLEPPGDDIQCHTMVKGDALPSAEGRFSPKENSIFFHETSCRGGLDSRQACAVESAAKLHPNRDVHILFSAPVEERILKLSCLAKLLAYPNIKLSRVHIVEYAKGTPLEEMINSDKLSQSSWHVEHTSDVLRYLTLYKWGGVYLDTDTLVVKSLDGLGGNWVGKEDNVFVNAAIIGISNDELGRRVIEEVARELSDTYKPEMWSYNGPGAITRVLKRMCNTTDLMEWTAENCQGFPVYGPAYFYPIHYMHFEKYFEAGELENVSTAYVHHFWNKLSKNSSVDTNSPYAKLAREFCPEIYDMYRDMFGQ